MHRPVNRPPVRVLPERRVGDMTTTELLGIVLGHDGAPVVGLAAAAALIEDGHLGPSVARPEDLATRAGISHECALVLAATFELSRRILAPEPPPVVRAPADVAVIAQRELGSQSRERVLVVVCDAGNRPQRTAVISDGSTDHGLVPVREILNAVLRWDGRAFAVAHNHPGGDPEPSAADVDATRRVADAAGVVGLRFLGHVVVAGARWVSVPTARPSAGC